MASRPTDGVSCVQPAYSVNPSERSMVADRSGAVVCVRLLGSGTGGKVDQLSVHHDLTSESVPVFADSPISSGVGPTARSRMQVLAHISEPQVTPSVIRFDSIDMIDQLVRPHSRNQSKNDTVCGKNLFVDLDLDVVVRFFG